MRESRLQGLDCMEKHSEYYISRVGMDMEVGNSRMGGNVKVIIASFSIG